MNQTRPVLGEERSDGVRENFALVVDIVQDILGPFHEVSDLVAWRRPVHAPRQLLFHLLA